MTEQQTRSARGVFVGVDGSAPSRAALMFAYRDAARREAPLHVVAVYSPPEYTAIWLETGVGPDLGEHGEITAEVRRKATEMIDGVRDELGGEPAPPAIDVTAVSGRPAGTLIGMSAEAELLVVGSRGHGGFASMMLGSVSLQCVLYARCPVTVVHAERQLGTETEKISKTEEATFDPLLATPLL